MTRALVADATGHVALSLRLLAMLSMIALVCLVASILPRSVTLNDMFDASLLASSSSISAFWTSLGSLNDSCWNQESEREIRAIMAAGWRDSTAPEFDRVELTGEGLESVPLDTRTCLTITGEVRQCRPTVWRRGAQCWEGAEGNCISVPSSQRTSVRR